MKVSHQESLIDPEECTSHLAKQIPSKLCALASLVDFVCNSYSFRSIKDIERDARSSRGSSNTGHYSIKGSEQKTPRNFQLALRSVLQFLADEWGKDAYAEEQSGS